MIASARTIILDRDGVLNELGQDYIKDVKELNIISRSMVAINVLLERKHNVVIASNQAGVAKNLLNRATLKDIEHEFHKHISCKLEFIYCTHLPADNCKCRKPKNGMLEDIKGRYKGPFLFVGDNITDYQCSIASEIPFVLVETGHGLKFKNDLKFKCKIHRDLLDLVIAMYPETTINL